MITWQRSSTVQASAEEAFDVIGTNVATNHPKWEKEVQSIRLLTPGPIGAGSRAVMVRKEMGRVRETEYEVTEFEAGRHIAFTHPQEALDFHLRFDVAPAGGDRCDVSVSVSAQPKGALRLIEPLMRLGFPRRCRRITDSMIRVIEATAADRAALRSPQG